MARRTAYLASQSATRRARIRTALASTGIEVRQVKERTSDVLAASAPGDLVVVDDAPARGLDALAFVESLRRERTDVAVVAITAGTDSERAEALLRAGASACVVGDDPRGWATIGPLVRGEDETH